MAIDRPPARSPATPLTGIRFQSRHRRAGDVANRGSERGKAKKAVDFGLGFLKYHELKTSYIEALLRGRMGSNITAGDDEKQYIAAEKLRKQEKFMDAGRAFTKLREQYPKSPWADAAGFRIGQCFWA